ncbi:hypothetical protein BDW59DRAFT_159912 [Aspergillus cavernicola]|uniref:Uncharacterized protein n=1 Tax=Aspergillus cavernicola TaxID=176166 RepID=A0ABR4IL46_9EURO
MPHADTSSTTVQAFSALLEGCDDMEACSTVSLHYSLFTLYRTESFIMKFNALISALMLSSMAAAAAIPTDGTVTKIQD